MTASLPAWADNDAARDLIATLLATPPSTFVRSPGAWRHDAEEVFSCKGPEGKPFAALRRLYRDWFELELKAMDVQFHVTGVWDDDASRAMHQVEDADALLRRLLNEQQANAQLTEVHGDPFGERFAA